MNFKTLYFLTLSGLAMAPVAWSQQEGLVATSPQMQTLVGTDLFQLIEQTYPKYEQGALEKRLADAARELQAKPDTIQVHSLQDIERLMGFPPSGARKAEVDTQKAYYRVDSFKGMVFAQHKNYAFVSTSRPDFEQMKAAVQKQHNRFVSLLGVPPEETMKTSFKKILELEGDAESFNPADTTQSRVRRGMSLGYRGYKGFPIEGSFFRVSSFNAKRVENFGLSWPRFVLHPGVKHMDLASSERIKKLILQELMTHVHPDRKVSLTMGIVFHQVLTPDGKLVHLPGMKVVLTPAPEQRIDGTMTQSGYEFFAQLLKEQPPTKNLE